MNLFTKRIALLLIVALLVVGAAGNHPARAQNVTEINFLYPTAVGGPISKVMDGLAQQFNQANPDVHVTATYGGGYTDVYKTIQTAISGGSAPPDVAVMLSTDLFSLVDNDYIISYDDLIKQMKDGDKYLA